jgi:hypothetical protein
MAYTIAAPRKYPPRHISGDAGELEPLRSNRNTLERVEAETGSERLRKRLLRYGSRHGLPNLSTLQCITELRLLGRVLEEDLILADKIQSEISGRKDPAQEAVRRLMVKFGIGPEEVAKLAKMADREIAR